MKNGFQFLLSGCSAIALLACGDDVTKMTNVTNETTGMEVAASADSLGTCDSAAIGKTVFASSESSVCICADSGWVPLSKTSASGKDGADGENGSDGASCTVAALSDSSGYKVVCGGDSVGVILNGADGKDGANGTSCTVAALSDGLGYKIVCGGDSVGVILNGADGKDGASGENGSDGKDGANGTSCTVAALSDGSGYKIVCGGDSVGVILNGTNGKDGTDGKDGTTNCSLTKNGDGTATLVCGETSVTYKAVSYDSLVDSRDGQVYKTVVIGTQTWMAENLNYEYNHGTAKSYCSQKDSSCKMGRFYTWAAAMDSAAVFSDGGKDCGNGIVCDASHPVRGACPEGWHLPNKRDWNKLYSSVDSLTSDSVGTALKSTSGWQNKTNGTDIFGFGGYPINYENYGNFVEYWSSSEITPTSSYNYNLSYISEDLRELQRNKTSPRTIRCVKD